MERQATFQKRYTVLIPWGAMILLGMFAVLLLNRLSPDWRSFEDLASSILVISVFGGLGFFCAREVVNGYLLKEKLKGLQLHHQEYGQNMQRRLDSLVEINRALIDSRNERILVETVLEILRKLVGALGCSFVPFDEFGQALMAYGTGKFPEPVITAWAEHLASPEVRSQCATCALGEMTPLKSCALNSGPFSNTIKLYCMPLIQGSKIMGMFNLYLPTDIEIDDSLKSFLDALLEEFAIALEAVRIRNQENATLEQLQRLRPPGAELKILIDRLIKDLQETLEVDFIFIKIDDKRFRNQSEYIISTRNDVVIQEYEQVMNRIIRTRKVVDLSGGFEWSSSGYPILGMPMFTSGGETLGGVEIGYYSEKKFYPRQKRVLQTVATQIALMIENERQILDLEYRIIIEERTRLAREIHDGLAQTLAFLKLQAAQMQGYLAQGELSRLQEVLHTNYKALSEAYLDIRQSIDNLRMSPDIGIFEWIEQIVEDFKASTGFCVTMNVLPLKQTLTTEIEVQLIRIIQEGLSNVRKHSNAKHVWINLHQWEQDLILEVRDDGQGFFAEDIPAISHHGLRGMRERSEIIGADFQVISSPETGTTIYLRLPLGVEESQV